MGKPSFFQMSEQASEHILRYHVSLGCTPLPGDRLSAPFGSGIFAKFQLDGRTIYGILTAAHIARDLPLIFNQNRQFIGLTKPSQTEEALACLVTFYLIYCSADIRYFNAAGRDAYRPDVAFIVLGIDKVPEHELICSSAFYDLDTNPEFLFEKDPQILSGFFRGACNLDEVSEDNFLYTPVCFGGGEEISYDVEVAVQYWKIPNKSLETIAGGSGSGFWRFRYNEEGILVKSLAGVITGEGEDFIEAISFSYLIETFLPGLKAQVKDLLLEERAAAASIVPSK